MDITALSMGLSQMKIAHQASISVLKLPMNAAEVQAVDMAKMTEQSVTPHISGTIDINL